MLTGGKQVFFIWEISSQMQVSSSRERIPPLKLTEELGCEQDFLLLATAVTQECVL